MPLSAPHSRIASAGTRLALASLALGLCCCNDTGVEWPGEYGPGPSPDIVPRVLTEVEYEASPDMVCTGPADEVAALGALCARATSNAIQALNAGDLSFAIPGEPASEAPFSIVVFGYLTDPGVFDHAADIRYAAYLVPSPDAYVLSIAWREAAFTTWPEAEALVGTIETVVAYDTSCSKGGFRGRASLVWRHTRIEFRFDAGFPC